MNTRIEATPSAKIAVLGGGLFAAGLLGFYIYQQRRYERNITFNHNSEISGLPAWQSRLLTKAKPVSEATSMASLRESFLEKRGPSSS